MEHPHRRLDDVAVGRDGRDLDHPEAEIAGKLHQPAGGLERVRHRAQDLVVLAARRAIVPMQPVAVELGLAGIGRQTLARDGLGVGVQQAGIEQLADHVGQPARGVEMVHVRQPVGIDPRHQRHHGGDFGEVLQGQFDPGGAGHRRQVQHEVGRAAGGHQSDEAVHEGLFVEHPAQRGELVAKPGDLERAFCRRPGERLAQGRAGIDEARPRQVQPHEFHQHLVGVGGAVEGAGAGAVIGGHLACHQLGAVGLAGGETLAHLGLFVVGYAAGHRPGGHENAGDMAIGRRRHHQPRHDLVADAQIERGIEGVVRERHGGGERDHVTRKQAEFHPRRRLGNTVAHRRNATGHLRGAALPAGHRFDQLGIIPERGMGRQHVVVAGHDPDIGRALGRQRALVGAGAGIGMGLVGTAQMRPRRALFGGTVDAVEIGGASGLRAVDDPPGDTSDLGMK